MMKKRLIYSSIFILSFIVSVLFSLKTPLKVSASSYNYNDFLNTIEAPEAMIVKQVIKSGEILNDENEPIEFGLLKDIFVLESETLGTRIYLLDQTKNRIIVLNENFEYIGKYPNFEIVEGIPANPDFILNSPSGIHVTEKYIYVADTEGQRVGVFTHNWGLKKSIKKPDDPTFETVAFKPLKVAVDTNERIYVVASNIFEGILDINPDYTFNRYVGSRSAELTFWQRLRSLLFTRAQESKTGLNLAVTYNNILVDNGGFIYALSSRNSGKPVQRINYKSDDVLKQNGYGPVVGDYQIYDQYSEFIDITIGESESYSILDRTMGRIFTYDFEGHLLYISGGANIFQIPEALTYFGENLLVVDSSSKSLVILEPSEFTHQVNKATAAYYQNDYVKAAEEWEKVLTLNTNYLLAYGGIGKAQYRQGKYQEAMENFKLASDIDNYSAAYKEYRTERLENILPYVIIIGFLGIIAILIRSVYKNLKHAKEEGGDE
jgi:tetratricopeptide (TPR) repeat protein